MRISIFGSGYVGLVQAAIFADVGHSVICMDVDADRIERLRQGQVPFFEPGLSTMVLQGVKDGLLTLTTTHKLPCRIAITCLSALAHLQETMVARISDMS